MLRRKSNPRNGTAIIEQIKGQQYLSAMGYMVQIDDNADASGNYTLLKLSDAMENGSGPLSFGLVPVGIFGAMDETNKLPVSERRDAGPSTALGLCVAYEILFHFKYVELSGDIYWVGGRPPIAVPLCGFRGELCISE